VADKGQVNYILSAPPVQEKPESAAEKLRDAYSLTVLASRVPKPPVLL
jgi:hypothetical protein